jgi:hypothetical protein
LSGKARAFKRRERRERSERTRRKDVNGKGRGENSQRALRKPLTAKAAKEIREGREEKQHLTTEAQRQSSKIASNCTEHE